MFSPSRSLSPEVSETLLGLEDWQLEALDDYQELTRLRDVEEAVGILESFE
jgi:hypothetical protein